MMEKSSGVRKGATNKREGGRPGRRAYEGERVKMSFGNMWERETYNEALGREIYGY